MRSVAFVLTLPYPEAVGGAERWVDEAAKALGRRVDISMHYMTGPARTPREPRAHDVLHPFRTPPGTQSDRLAISPSLIRDVAGADVVHVHQYGSLSAMALATLRRLRRRPVFVTDQGSGGGGVGRRLGLNSLFSGFLEISQFAAENRPPSRTRVVWGGVDTERFQPGPKDPEPFALFVGRLLPHKGIDVVIEALPAGRRLVIAGRPDLKNHRDYYELLQARARDRNVEFILDAPDTELARLYASAAVTLLPSLYVDVYGTRHSVPELLGFTLMESLSSGTPVIATRVGSLPEVVTDGETGTLVAPGDVEEMQRALEQYLADPDAAAAAGARGREDVRTRFTWDRVAERCLSAYAELG